MGQREVLCAWEGFLHFLFLCLHLYPPTSSSAATPMSTRATRLQHAEVTLHELIHVPISCLVGTVPHSHQETRGCAKIPAYIPWLSRGLAV